jgi:hypothetical protein
MGGGPNLRQANVNGVPNSVDPSNYYLPGIGAPAIATSDYYYSDGWYWARAWTIGNGQYFWPLTSDHANGSNAFWMDGQDFRVGLSSDPQVMPTQANTQAIIRRQIHSPQA